MGGDVDYVRSVGEVRGYYPLTKDFTLVGRGLAGNIFNWNSGGYIRTWTTSTRAASAFAASHRQVLGHAIL